jgi:hypothetical protein
MAEYGPSAIFLRSTAKLTSFEFPALQLRGSEASFDPFAPLEVRLTCLSAIIMTQNPT